MKRIMRYPPAPTLAVLLGSPTTSALPLGALSAADLAPTGCLACTAATAMYVAQGTMATAPRLPVICAPPTTLTVCMGPPRVRPADRGKSPPLGHPSATQVHAIQATTRTATRLAQLALLEHTAPLLGPRPLWIALLAGLANTMGTLDPYLQQRAPTVQ